MRLLAITPPRALAPTIDPDLVQAWTDAGAQEYGLAVLLREPRASPAAISSDPRLKPLREALAAHGVPALVSVDPRALSPEAGAELLEAARPRLAGVQLRGDPSPALCKQWRAALGPAKLIGRSAHGLIPSVINSLNYTCVAPIFPPRTRLPGEDKQAIGLEGLRAWTGPCAQVLALGGVSPANAAACLAAGAHGVAGIRLFFGRSDEARHNAEALVEAFSATEPLDHAPQAPR